MKGKIRVYCRLRPLTEKEISEKERNALATTDEFTVEHTWRDDKVKQHMYDRVFNGNATQEDVFEDTKVCSINLWWLFFSEVYLVLMTIYMLFYYVLIWLMFMDIFHCST